MVGPRSHLDVWLRCDYVVTMAKSSGRKVKAAASKAVKDDVVRMRVSGDQKTALVEAATRDGLELSQWLRQLALRAAGLLPGASDRP